MASNIQKWKRWFKPLEHTPFHPQWTALRRQRNADQLLREYAKGILVDIGCGNGTLRKKLTPDIRYIGIDYPSTMSLGYFGSPDILADAEQLPFFSSSIDTVVMFDLLEHLPDAGKAVAEASRVLRPGGNCIVHVPFLYPLHDEPFDFQRWTQHGLKHLFTRVGFQVHTTVESTAPMETTATLTCIALAKGLIDAANQRSPRLLLAPLILALIPVVNVAGWLLARLLPFSRIMPRSYYLVATAKIMNKDREHISETRDKERISDLHT